MCLRNDQSRKQIKPTLIDAMNSPNPSAGKHKVAVALCTYRRESMLRAALESIGKMRKPRNLAFLIVVDNDADQTALPTVTRFAQSTDIEVVYQNEPKKGIAHARQRAVDQACRLGCSLLAFFDDDACVDPLWLVNLLAAYADYPCMAVTGEQKTILPENCPVWIKQGSFFERKKPRNEGKILKGAATNNVLFNLEFVHLHGIRFDSRFNHIGGSDTDFFWRFYLKGGIIVWTNKAIVYENITENRASFKWLFNRSLAYGARKIMHQRVNSPKHPILFTLAIILGFIGRTFGLIASLFFGKILFLRALIQWGRSLGQIKSLLGFYTKEYA